MNMKTVTDFEQIKLRLDCNTQYNKDSNQLDLYTSFDWSAASQEEYDEKAKFLDGISLENELYDIYAWYDISGYDYWVIQQQESNHTMVTVTFKVTELTSEQIEQLRSDCEDVLIQIENGLCDILEKYEAAV